MKKNRFISLCVCGMTVVLAMNVSARALIKQGNSPVKSVQTLVKTKEISARVGTGVSPKATSMIISYAMSTDQNKRPYQEDRFAYAANIGEGGFGGGKFFGVYDGHGGDRTSSFLESNLHTYFSQNLVGQISPEKAFESVFLKAEKYALDNYDDGSTALAAYIDKNNVLYCAWVGDTRAVLEKNGKVGFFTNDHKPDSEDEKKRIEKAGGRVRMQGVWRVNGLAVSRSIGDASCKKKGVGQIIAIPECAQVQLTSDSHFLILASDGLWDVVDNEQAVEMVKKELDKKIPLNSIALLLQNFAIKKGSGDNITVCIIAFDWTGQDPLVISEKSTTAMPWYRRISPVRFWNWLRGR